ncbi:MAG: sensor histidine kinase [Bacteroidales bacterium]
MLNPILTYRKNFITYSISMIFILLMHLGILYLFFDFPLLISFADAGIYTGLTFLFGIGAWYVVKYLTISEQKHHVILADHLVTGGIVVLIWLFSGYLMLSTLFSENQMYQEFLSTSLPWRFVYFILIYAVIVMIYYLINYYRNYQDKLLEEAQLKQAVQESELNLLKSQINPHFLFNSLNSIHSLIMADPDKASEMILELSDFLRYTVRRDENEQVTLKDELANIQRYLDIEKIRFGKRVVVEDEIDNSCLERKIPNMILQPIYENAIKHGVNESTDAVVITTKCAIERDELHITISNNYSPGNISRKGKGIGIENIKKRLFLHFKRNDLMKIERNSHTFTVQLMIPNTEPITIEL